MKPRYFRDPAHRCNSIQVRLGNWSSVLSLLQESTVPPPASKTTTPPTSAIINTELNGQTVLDIALQHQHLEIAAQLITMGATRGRLWPTARGSPPSTPATYTPPRPHHTPPHVHPPIQPPAHGCNNDATRLSTSVVPVGASVLMCAPLFAEDSAPLCVLVLGGTQFMGRRVFSPFYPPHIPSPFPQ